jgi:hypothetical protein
MVTATDVRSMNLVDSVLQFLAEHISTIAVSSLVFLLLSAINAGIVFDN